MKYINGLKPCPFCARQPSAYFFERTKLWVIACECGAESPSNSVSENGAKKIWNRRRYINS